MSIIDNVKSLVNIVRQIDNLDLYKKILDLQGEVINLVDENHTLRKEKESLQEKFRVRESLRFERNSYWSEKQDGTKDGPFCSKCWDSDQLLVRMLKENHPQEHICPKCKVPVNTSGRPYDEPEISVVTTKEDARW